MKSKIFFTMLSIVLAFWGCAEAEFGAGENKGGSSSSGADSGGTDSGGQTDAPDFTGQGQPDAPDGPDSGPDSGGLDSGGGPPNQNGPCVKNGVVELKYPALIQGCVDQGKLFNFDTEECTTMSAAKFTCDFDTTIKAIKDLGLNPAGIEKGRDANGLIVGCGQSDDGKTIVAQWWANPSKDSECTFDAATTSITTGCYQRVEGDPGPPPQTQEEIAAKVLECINSN